MGEGRVSRGKSAWSVRRHVHKIAHVVKWTEPGNCSELLRGWRGFIDNQFKVTWKTGIPIA